MTRTLIAILALLPISPASAQPTTPEAQRFASLLVGQQIVQLCGVVPGKAARAKLDTELAARRRQQHEMSDREVQVMTGRLQENLGSPANRAKVCGELNQIGVDAYIDQIVRQ